MANELRLTANHEYFVGDSRLPGVSEILQAGGFIPERILNARTDFGVALHKLCELWDTRTLNLATLDPQLITYLEGYRKFLVQYELRFSPNEIEQKMYSKIWKFAGTFDRIKPDRGLLLDIKSGDPAPHHELQTAAYQVLVEENLGIKIKHRWSVKILPDDFKVFEHKSRADKIVLGAVSGYYWKKEHNLLEAK